MSARQVFQLWFCYGDGSVEWEGFAFFSLFLFFFFLLFFSQVLVSQAQNRGVPGCLTVVLLVEVLMAEVKNDTKLIMAHNYSKIVGDAHGDFGPFSVHLFNQLPSSSSL